MSARSVSETVLVAYLRAKGYKETSRPKLVGSTVCFFFEDSPKLRQEIDVYFTREGIVEPMAMQENLNLLKGLITDIRRNPRTGGDSDER
jgi:hypothetical protein